MTTLESRLTCGADFVLMAHERSRSIDESLLQTQVINQIQWAARNGFSGIELWAGSLGQFKRIYSKVFAERIRQELAKNRINVCQFLCNFVIPMIISSPNEVANTALNEILGGLAEIPCGVLATASSPVPGTSVEYTSAYLGGPPTRIGLHSNFDWNTAWEKYVGAISFLVDIAGDYGLKVALEPRPREMISNSDGLLSLIHAVNSSNFGALVDTAHMFVQREHIPLSIMKLRDRIFAVHLTDSDGLIEHHWAPGDGKVEWTEVLDAFRYIGYDRALTINAFGVLGSPAEEFLGAKRFLETIISNVRVVNP
jgi:sugar phosphate isomerase/epimerase